MWRPPSSLFFWDHHLLSTGRLSTRRLKLECSSSLRNRLLRRCPPRPVRRASAPATATATATAAPRSPPPSRTLPPRGAGPAARSGRVSGRPGGRVGEAARARAGSRRDDVQAEGCACRRRGSPAGPAGEAGQAGPGPEASGRAAAAPGVQEQDEGLAAFVARDQLQVLDMSWRPAGCLCTSSLPYTST